MKEKLKLWKTLCSKLKQLSDNNYTARKIYDSLFRK